MKKIFLSMMLVGAMCAQANVAYVLVGADTKNELPTEQSEVNYGTEEEPDFRIENQDPEINFSNWFDENYVFEEKGDFITVKDIATRAADYDLLVINCDRVGLDKEAFKAFFDNATVEALKKYVADGGNLYLSKQATILLYMMGRIGYEPAYNCSGYMKGGDIWSINPQLALWPYCGEKQDNREHPIFDGLALNDTLFTVLERMPEFEGEEVPSVPYGVIELVGMDPRTDNNCFWIDYFRKDPTTGGQLAADNTYGIECHYANDNGLRLTDFEADWNCKPLAAWGQVVDCCAPGIIEWYGETENAGTVITNGFAAYQWGKGNSYLENVKKLTANIIAYLGGAEIGEGIENTELKAAAVKTIVNGQVVIRKNGINYNVLGTQL